MGITPAGKILSTSAVLTELARNRSSSRVHKTVLFPSTTTYLPKIVNTLEIIGPAKAKILRSLISGNQTESRTIKTEFLRQLESSKGEFIQDHRRSYKTPKRR